MSATRSIIIAAALGTLAAGVATVFILTRVPSEDDATAPGTQTTQTQTFWGRTFAGSVVASLPVIILFLALQKYYVQGVAVTGMKG